MGSAAGVLKGAANRIGVTVAEYNQRVAAGLKWCTGCKEWHSRSAFSQDKSRTDGLASRCKTIANQKSRAAYVPQGRPSAGRRFVQPRDGDRKQARRRVNYLVEAGLLPRPNNLPCADCGHTWIPGQSRHEYDHHRGYASEHHEDVEAVCTTCHHARETDRRNRSVN